MYRANSLGVVKGRRWCDGQGRQLWVAGKWFTFPGMKLVLKSPNEAPFEPGKDFSVVIACADSSTAAPACEVLELIEGRITDEGRLFYQWWNFEVLTVESLRELAAVEAATADIIIIGLHEGRGLPREVSEWMKQWLGLRAGRPGALVALLAADLKTTAASERILAHLRAAAEFGHLEFFATRAREGGDAEVARWAGRAIRQFGLAHKTSAPGGRPGVAEECPKESAQHQKNSSRPS